MCGIAGILSHKGINRNEILKMSSRLAHRGPDGFGYLLFSPKTGIRIFHNTELPFFEDNEYSLCLIHRRLSIIDLSEKAVQPMADSTGSVFVTYNGEIYNYLELRKELENLGEIFQTDSDTEVLINAYKRWGIDCVNKFNGMWAFIIVDLAKKKIFASRDRFGIKPLFYSQQGETLYLSSEIKSIVSIESHIWKPNKKIVADYLFFGIHDHSQDTFFDNIYNITAANNASIAFPEGSIKIDFQRYWSISPFHDKKSEKCINNENIEVFKSLFIDSIKIHGRSDVRIGTCLSGGLDSSSIVCTAHHLHKQNFLPNLSHDAFGYCANDEELSEYRYMKEVADKTGVQLFIIQIKQQEFDSILPEVVKIQDEPFGSISIIAQWFVFNKANEQGIKVMMDGQGADEILGGYHSYYPILARQLLSDHDFSGFLFFYFQYKKLFGTFPLPVISVVQFFLPQSLNNLINGIRWRLIKNVQLSDGNDYYKCLKQSIVENVQNPPSNVNLNNNLNEALKYALQTYSLPSLLRYEDRNSMANGIEARVPFLDYRLVEFLFSLPYQYKIKGAITKFILRESMKSLLPEIIQKRTDKLGFKPESNLLFSYVENNLNEIVENRSPYEKEWFDKKNLEHYIKNSIDGQKNEELVWRIVNLKIWLRQFWNN
jgi:asparagine synthase (glutamine-hydrolysing)